jgi:hypothetical protein
MKLFFTLVVLMTCNGIFAQSKSNCKIEIYLVKKYIYCWDTINKKITPFEVSLADLQDTAFIKNEEIVSYTFRKFKRKYRLKSGKSKRFTHTLHSIKISSLLNERIDSLHLSLFGCAKQFAIVCDGEVIYGGCVNNPLSSWVPPSVILTGSGNFIHLSFYPTLEANDPRENEKLFDCLKKSKRFKYLKKDGED